MQQRLGLAVALVARPELVVLDEPTSALDPLGRVDVRDIVLSLKARGVAVLLNSHLIGEVERVCDRVVILDPGRVAASGTLAELLGQHEVRLHLTGLYATARGAAGRRPGRSSARATGSPSRSRPTTTAHRARPGPRPRGLGVRVHAVEPARISLEERLLGILRPARGADAMTRPVTVLTVAALTLREAARRRVLPALAVLTVALLALSGWGFSELAAETGRHADQRPGPAGRLACCSTWSCSASA